MLPIKSIISRALLLGAYLWFLSHTQTLIGVRPLVESLVDHSHEFTAWFNDHVNTTLTSEIFFQSLSGFLLDLALLALCVRFITASSHQPRISFALVGIMRQCSQFMVSLPLPKGLNFRHPGFPTLFVTYNVANDFYFSGHTANCVLFALELSRMTRDAYGKYSTMHVAAIVFGWLSSIVQVFLVLGFRSHYIMDVITALLAVYFADSESHRIVKWLSKSTAAEQQDNESKKQL